MRRERAGTFAAVTALRYLHLLALAFFLGGQLMLAAAVVPALRGRDREGMRAVARRFGWGSLGALAVLLATGAAMASEAGRWDDPVLHAKLGLFVLLAVLIGWHIRRPALRALDAVVLLASLVVAWLGVTLTHG